MSMDKGQPKSTSREDFKKAREQYRAEIEKHGLPSHRIIKMTDIFYGVLKEARLEQMEFIIAIAFSMFDNAKKMWLQMRINDKGLVLPDKTVIKPGGQI